MTAIPHEVIVPQVFSLFQVAFSQFVRMLKVGVVRDLCTGVGITRDSGSSGFQGRMGARRIPCAQICHFQGSESQHSPIHRSDPQHSWHDRDLVKSTTKLWPRFTGRSPWTEKDQPRNEHCSCPQKGIGAQSIAASRSSVRMTRSQNSKSLKAWGRKMDPQDDYESSPTMT